MQHRSNSAQFARGERCKATWRQTQSVKTCCCIQGFKKKQKHNRGFKDMFRKALNLIQADMQCKEAGKEGRGGRTGRCRETSNWPHCGFFQTLDITLQYHFDTACLWKWNHDKSVTVKRNPKEVALQLCSGQSLSEEAAVQRFYGTTGWREMKEEIKRRSNHVG